MLDARAWNSALLPVASPPDWRCSHLDKIAGAESLSRRRKSQSRQGETIGKVQKPDERTPMGD